MTPQEKLMLALVLTLTSNAVLLLILLWNSTCEQTHTEGMFLCRPTTDTTSQGALERPGYLTVPVGASRPDDDQHILLSLLRLKLSDSLHTGRDVYSTINSLLKSRHAGIGRTTPHNTDILNVGLHGARDVTQDPGYTREIIHTELADRRTSDVRSSTGNTTRRTEDSHDQSVDTMNGQTIGTRDGQTISTRAGQTISTMNGQTISTRDGQTVSAMDGQTISTRNGQTISTRAGQTVSAMDGQPIHIEDEQSINRTKRQAARARNRTSTQTKVHEILSALTEEEVDKFQSPVSDTLIPALIQFEVMVIRDIERIHETLVAQDLRLENLEKVMLHNAEENQAEPQSDSIDNKSSIDNIKHVLEEGFIPQANVSDIIEMQLLEPGSSGDGEVGSSRARGTTTRKPVVTPWKVPEYYDLFRQLTSMEQKVMALENYNIMSDSELTRVRSEVIKMDDKVTELDRKSRNIQMRMTMHAFKINELEAFKGKTDLSLQNSLDSYGRINSRLEAFKDRLVEMKNDLRGVVAQYKNHDQITNELRSADSYKAHDIQEMRKTVFAIESRLQGIYRVVDQNVDMVRVDLKAFMERICKNNKLAC